MYVPALLELSRTGQHILVFLVDVRDPLLPASDVPESFTIINKNDDRARYESISGVDRVFVVTTDDSHVEVARRWLREGALSDWGAVIIEKPISSSLEGLRALLDELGDRVLSHVFGFDHYLACVEPLRQELGVQARQLLERGGARVTFSICEAAPIPPERARALRHGVGLDLLPHALAVLNAILSKQGKRDVRLSWLRQLRVEKCRVLRYEGAPIEAETYLEAYLRDGRDNQMVLEVGKGCYDRKLLEISNRKSGLLVDFVAGTARVDDRTLSLEANPVSAMVRKSLRPLGSRLPAGVHSVQLAQAILEFTLHLTVRAQLDYQGRGS